ncbi:MAG TPA: hypothetical protein VLI07_18575 [Candidatus Binatus sp.]|nr:hypothetical protein [Candidatus Binatus sp.]
MAYTRQTWTDDLTLVDAAHMSHIEDGIFNADAAAATAQAGLPPAVVNGQWLKGVGGAMQWQPIAVGDLAFAGQPNGVATLDGTGQVPSAQLRIPTITKIADITLGSAAATIDFTSIAATYAHLRLEWMLRGDTAAASTALYVRFNNDSGANYCTEVLTASVTTAGAQELASQNQIQIGSIAAATAPANWATAGDMDIPLYAGGWMKHVLVRGGYAVGITTTSLQPRWGAAVWASTAAINRITVLAAAGNLVAGSRVTLYGLN